MTENTPQVTYTYDDSCRAAAKLEEHAQSYAALGRSLERLGYPTAAGGQWRTVAAQRAAKRGHELTAKGEASAKVDREASAEPKGSYRGPSKRALESLQLTWGDIPPAIRSELKADLLAHLLGGAA